MLLKMVKQWKMYKQQILLILYLFIKNDSKIRNMNSKKYIYMYLKKKI